VLPKEGATGAMPAVHLLLEFLFVEKTFAPRILNLVAATALMLSSAACNDKGPTRPGRDPMAPPGQVEAFLPAFLEEQERILPTLEDRRTAQELDDRLNRLVTFLKRRDANRAIQEVNLTRAALRYYGPSIDVRTADGAELGAIEILIDRCSVLLGIAPLPSRAPAGS
jgi:hypothetical protein